MRELTAELDMGRFPNHPGHPERICWGCEHFCPADDMRCGNGTERAQHPIELWGEDWMSMEPDQTRTDPEGEPNERLQSQEAGAQQAAKAR